MKSKKGKKGIVVVRHLKDVKPIFDVCGEIRALSSKDDFPKANLTVATMKAPTEPHYHKKGTEFYFVLKGGGKLIVGDNTYEIKKNMMIIIPPNLAHYTIPRKPIQVVVFTVPVWSKDDQFVLKKFNITVRYSEHKEKSGLINEILEREGLSFKKGMSRKERDNLDVERQFLVLRAGWNGLSIPELRKSLRVG